MACWTRHRCPDIRRFGRERDRETGPPASACPLPNAVAQRLTRVFRDVRRLPARAGRWPHGLSRRRRVADPAGPFMDYGADWPPVPQPLRAPHALVRRCVAIVVVYAVIWAFGSALLELRLLQLRGFTGGAPVTTYTTISGPPRH